MMFQKIPVWFHHMVYIFLLTFLLLAFIFEWKIYIQEYVGYPTATTEPPTTMEVAHGECSWDLFISNRINEAESNWIRARRKHEEIAEKLKKENKLLSAFPGVAIWDLFYPSFTCPFTLDRLGRVGDGGKWVCGFLEEVATKSPCVIYSFGIGGEVTFEEEILQRTKNCIIRMFDHTISQRPLMVNSYEGRAHWYPLGLSNKTSVDMTTLKSIMDSHQDEFLEILKVDIEGAEWEALKQILIDYPNTLPFSQLLLEIHLPEGPDTEKAKFFLDWAKSLEDAGLRIFQSELNYGFMESHQFSEFSFLNIHTVGRKDYKTIQKLNAVM